MQEIYVYIDDPDNTKEQGFVFFSNFIPRVGEILDNGKRYRVIEVNYGLTMTMIRTVCRVMLKAKPE